MDDLMAKNRPEHMKQTTQEQTVAPTPVEPQLKEHHVVINWTMPEFMERIENRLQTLEEQSAWQTKYLRRLCERPTAYPTQVQMDELLKVMKRLEEMTAQVGKKKEKHFSLPKLRLPRPHLPNWDGPTVATVVMALVMVALLLVWFKSGGDWSNLSSLLP